LQRRDSVGHDIGTARALRASTTYDWIALIKMTKLLEIRAAYGRGRRALRRQLLEPVLVGWPVLREVVTNALAARGHLVFCDLGDVRFFVDPSDRVVGSWLMWHGGWQRREIDSAVEVLAAAGKLARDAVFVDVGAHIGTHTVYALRTGRFARAIAFEPEPRNARLLAMNLEANGLSPAALVVPKAAGAAPGTAVLYLHPRNTGAHSLDVPPSIDGRASLEVPVVRVEDALNELGIGPDQVGLAWLDVEGYELQALRGLTKLIERSVPIAFEFTPSRHSARTRAELVALLERHYTTVHSLGRMDACAPIQMLASREHTDDVLVY
jgi:FkbM family methyltransferase